MESLAIITTAASAALGAVHHRQPAIVGPNQLKAWLDPATGAGRLLNIVRTPREGPYEIRRISTLVNNVRNDSPDVLAAVDGGHDDADAPDGR